MLEKRTVSQCTSSDYCKGWNDAVDELPKWIDVNERLPEEKGQYIVAYHPCYWDDVKDEIAVGIDSFRGGKIKTNKAWARNKYQRVTHWMPLPEPPKEGVNNG